MTELVIGAIFAKERLELFDLDDRAGGEIRGAQQNPADFDAVRGNRLERAAHFAAQIVHYAQVQMNPYGGAGKSPGIEVLRGRGLCRSEFFP